MPDTQHTNAVAQLDRMITDAVADGRMTPADAASLHTFHNFLRETPKSVPPGLGDGEA